MFPDVCCIDTGGNCQHSQCAPPHIAHQVSMALKQKSDIEHYRNKLRLKAKRKGYYDFPAINSGYKSGGHRQRYSHEKLQLDFNKGQDADDEKASTYVKSRKR